jgi:hypothetical protein
VFGGALNLLLGGGEKRMIDLERGAHSLLLIQRVGVAMP